MDAHPAPVTEAVADALGDWRRDGLLLCLLPVFWWPAVVAAVLTRPLALVVLLSPVVLGVRELHAVRRARRALREPAVRWIPYEAVVVRARWRPPVLVLADGRYALTLGVLGRRVLPPRPWPRTAPGAQAPSASASSAPSAVSGRQVQVVQVVQLAGDPAAGGVLWAPYSGGLGRARPVRCAAPGVR